MPDIITFEDAVERSTTPRHVLLGNGFSRAFRDDIFSYDALFDRANFGGMSPAAREAFQALQTKDFEIVIKALRQAAQLGRVYFGPDVELIGRLESDANALRDLLARTIAANHPDRPTDIRDEQYAACRSFLNNFKNIYSVNYDLLLYWALMRDEIPPLIGCDDGFREPDDGPAEYVTWDVQKTVQQCIFYLHGALHIFDAGSKLQKFTWSNTGIALIDQIRGALDSNRFPLFVAEGSADSKLERIQHSGFLNRAYRSFAEIRGSLFVFGLSFGGSDEHILRLLDHGKQTQIFVSLYGDPDSEGNARIVRRAELIPTRRSRKYPTSIAYFDAESAQVWD
jgi:hypothetical protein